MTRSHRALFLVVLLVACQTAGWAESKPLELRWNELAPLIVGRQVELTLAEGRKLKAEAVTVRDDALVVDVKKASGPYKKGNGVIPRGSLTLIKLVQTRGSWGRTLGTVVGVLTGLTVGGYAAATATNSASAGIPLFLAVSAAGTLAGYYAGREIDRRVTTIRVVP